MRITIIALLLIGTLSVQGQVSYEVEALNVRPRAMDYAPTFYQDGFVMCSMRELNSLVAYEQESSFLPFADMYYVPLDSNGAGKPSLLSEKLVSPVHDGPAAFTADGNTICFTRNLDVPDGLKDHMGDHNRLGLFFADKEGTEWGEPRLFDWNHEEFSSMHPSFSNDGQLLFFATDIPGGFGGSDIYICYREGANDWSIPMNLGPQVNGPYNELFPFIHASGLLYFASNRPGGIGGIDIYSSMPVENGFGEPSALPEPINSTDDDLGLCFRNDHEDGLFSSNRKGMDRIYRITRTVAPFLDCVPVEENSYCYSFEEEGTFESDTLPLMYQWDLGDGTTVTDLIVDHCYAGPGSYTVKLNIIDTLTNSIFFNEATYDLVVEDIVQPYILADDTVQVGTVITIDGTRSKLSEFKIDSYHWDLGDGNFRYGPAIEHFYNSTGWYELKMEVQGHVSGAASPERHCVTRNLVVVDEKQFENVLARRDNSKLRLNEKSNYDFQQLPYDQFLMAIREGEDVFFTVELFNSTERIALNDAMFDNIRPYYPILERYIPENKHFSYSVGKTKQLEDTYDIYSFVKNLKYMDAEVMVMLEEKFRDADAISLNLDPSAIDELNNTVVRFSTVYFGYRQEMFEPQFKTHLNKLLLILNRFEQVEVVISAHTDNVGSDPYNLNLSNERAKNVKKYFLEQGVDSDRLTAIGYGEDHPIADNSEETGRDMNRRVEFKLILPRDAVAETEER